MSVSLVCCRSYQILEGGNSADVISCLTGAPYKTYKLQGERGRRGGPDHDAIWAAILSGDQQGFVLTAAVPDDPSVDLFAVAGLVEGHAYGVISAAEVRVL